MNSSLRGASEHEGNSASLPPAHSHILLRAILLPLILAMIGCCIARCQDLDIRLGSDPLGGDFILNFPNDVPGLEIGITTVQQHPDVVLWKLRAESSSKVPRPLSLAYGTVPAGMEEGSKALPIAEGTTIAVMVLYSNQSYWGPICWKNHFYKRVGGRFIEAWEQRE